MAPLLEALWLLGLDTEFSCQGHPDRYIPNQEATHQWGAYVLFTRIEDAFTFLTKTIELLDYDPRTEGRMYLSPMATPAGQPARASVSFPPALLDALTSAWIDFGKTITSSSGDIPPS